MQRCFEENPYFKDGHIQYGTSDPLTMDFSDVMNFIGRTMRGNTVDREKWNVMFERFKTFWDLDIENPYTESPESIIEFFHKMESLDDGMTDEWSKEMIENNWRISL